MKAKKIVFRNGNENRPQIENLVNENWDNLMFAEQYYDTMSQIEDYLIQIGEYEPDDMSFDSDANNNIFAFLGDRGSGKTSCMLSVAKLLTDSSKQQMLSNFPELKRTHFYKIGMVDPSYFDEKHNILSIVLAQLYNAYLKTLDGNSEKYSYADKSALLKCFTNAQTHLNGLITKSNTQYDELEQLVLLASSVTLKKDIYDLVKQFRIYMGHPENSKLLLVVDDLDLNAEDGSKMAELIRKYFIQPNVVVLMSMNLAQFTRLKQQESAKAYQTLIQHESVPVDSTYRMAEQYVAKLIPQSHRIYMPDMEAIYDLPLEIMDEKYRTDLYPSVKQAVTQLIFQKTRYLFYNTEFRVSDIVPRNLRDLRQLLKLLHSMPAYREERDDKTNEYNKDLFKKYFFVTWVKNNFVSSRQKDIEEILQEDNFSQINNKVVKILKRSYADSLSDSILNNENVLKSITSEANMGYNISVGDVFALLDLLQRQCVKEEDQRFIFFLKSFYSIRLYEGYDVMTDAILHPVKQDDIVVVGNEAFSDLHGYEKIVGGSFINTEWMKLLWKRTDKGEPQQLSNITYQCDHLINLIDACLNNKSKKPNLFDYRLVELMMLCTYRDTATDLFLNTDESGIYDMTFRRKRTLCYDWLDRSQRYVFDLGALMFNLTRLERCYKRFYRGKEFYNSVVALGTEADTLYGRFARRTIADKYSVDDTYHLDRWESYCSIRNSEVLDRFIDYMLQLNVKTFVEDYILGKETTKFAECLSEFNPDEYPIWVYYWAYFKRASKFAIKTYDLDKSSKPYEIQFGFYQEIASMFEEMTEEERVSFKSLFDTQVLESTLVQFGIIKPDSKQ